MAYVLWFVFGILTLGIPACALAAWVGDRLGVWLYGGDE